MTTNGKAALQIRKAASYNLFYIQILNYDLISINSSSKIKSCPAKG